MLHDASVTVHRKDHGFGMNHRELIFIFLMFIAAVLIRLLAVSSQPSFAGTGDSGSWIALAREIRTNNFIIPAANSIHYPGSDWVYPPVVPYLLAVVSLAVGQNGMGMAYAVAAAAIMLQSLTLFPVYGVVRKLYGAGSAAIAAAIFVAYPPMIYLITWSALPQITAFFIIALVIWLLSSVQKESRAGIRTYAVMFVLSFLLVLVHDLSAFVYILCILSALLYFTITGRRKGADYNGSLVGVLATGLVASVSAVLLWYIPRLQWLSEFSSISARTAPAALFQILRTDVLNLASPLAVPNFVFLFSSVFIPLFAFFIIDSYAGHRKGEKTPVLIFGIVLFAVTLFSIPFSIIFVRLSYFLLFLYAFIAPFTIYRFMYPSRGNSGGALSRKVRTAARVFGIFVIVFIVMYSAWGVTYEYNAHTYYLSNGDQGPGELTGVTEWISRNVNQDSVIAASGSIGFLIMGYAGNPVINNVSRTMLTQFVEVRESNAAGVLVNNPLRNETSTLKLIHEYNVSYVVTGLSSSEVPVFYYLSYSTESIFVYRT